MTNATLPRPADDLVVVKPVPGAAAARSARTRSIAGEGPGRPIRLLVFTSLYPNAAQPRHGVFVEERLRKLVESGRIEATVVAPVPWFPFRHPWFGAYATFARVPSQEVRNGIPIFHPRYPVIAKIGANIAPFLMCRAVLPSVRALAAGHGFDLIDAHYLYPDGVAAVALGETLGMPVVATARGSDVMLIPRTAGPRRQIVGAAARSDAIITVSAALRCRLAELGVAANGIQVLRNGVDLERFKPVDAQALRGGLGVAPPIWLTVGRLIELKGVHIVLEALAQCPDVTLLVAGDGPEERALRDLSHRLGVDARVRFLGAVVHDELPRYYSAADALVLASSREGMPNVALESLACGTPVVAAPFHGVDEVVNAPEAGAVAEGRTASAITAAWRRLSLRRPERGAVRRFAEQFGWKPVVDAQCALYARVLATARIGQVVAS